MKKAKKDRARFERQVAELKAALEKLPADRQEQLARELTEKQKAAATAKIGRG